jgi:hypothetical protein
MTVHVLWTVFYQLAQLINPLKRIGRQKYFEEQLIIEMLTLNIWKG